MKKLGAVVLVAGVAVVSCGSGTAAQQQPKAERPTRDFGQERILIGREVIDSACDGHGHRVYLNQPGDNSTMAVIDDEACRQ